MDEGNGRPTAEKFLARNWRTLSVAIGILTTCVTVGIWLATVNNRLSRLECQTRVLLDVVVYHGQPHACLEPFPVMLPARPLSGDGGHI